MLWSYNYCHAKQNNHENLPQKPKGKVMNLTDTAVFERFSLHDQQHARMDERVKVVEVGHRDVWNTIDGMRNLISSVRIQVASIVAVGVLVQAVFTAYLVYKITKG